MFIKRIKHFKLLSTAPILILSLVLSLLGGQGVFKVPLVNAQGGICDSCTTPSDCPGDPDCNMDTWPPTPTNNRYCSRCPGEAASCAGQTPNVDSCSSRSYNLGSPMENCCYSGSPCVVIYYGSSWGNCMSYGYIPDGPPTSDGSYGCNYVPCFDDVVPYQKGLCYCDQEAWNRDYDDCELNCSSCVQTTRNDPNACTPPDDDGDDDVVVDPECDVTSVEANYGGNSFSCYPTSDPGWFEVPINANFDLDLRLRFTEAPEPYEIPWIQSVLTGVVPAVYTNHWCDYTTDYQQGASAPPQQTDIITAPAQCPSTPGDYIFNAGCQASATPSEAACWSADLDQRGCRVRCLETFACSLALVPGPSGQAPYTITSYTPTITDGAGTDNWWLDYDYSGAEDPCGGSAVHVWDNAGSGLPDAADLGTFTYVFAGNYGPTLRLQKGADYACCSANLDVSPRPNTPPDPPVIQPRTSQAEPQERGMRKTKLIGSGYKHFPSDRIIVRQTQNEPPPFSLIRRISASLIQVLKRVILVE